MNKNLQEGIGVLGVIVTVIVTVYCYQVIQENKVLKAQADILNQQTTVLEQKLDEQTTEKLVCIDTTKSVATYLRKSLDILNAVTNSSPLIDSNVAMLTNTNGN
jgi:hypothetical protein